MGNHPTSLYLFTAQYPYGTGESFIENELAVLSKKFSKIYIFPENDSGAKRAIPVNAEVVNWQKDYHYKGVSVLFRNLTFFLKTILLEFFKSADKIIFLKQFSTLRSMLLQNINRAAWIGKYISKAEENNIVFYSFWFENWATVLGVLQQKNKISHYYSRVHGFDLYVERRLDGFIPFRNFQMKTVKSVFTVSEMGRNYLTSLYPQYHSKIKLSYLGVLDNGKNPFNKEAPFTLISCSNIIKLKRVHLIIEILKNLHFPINWVHFGAGEEAEKIKKMAESLPANVKAVFKGQVETQELIQFYKSNPVSLFITTSETEGLPVSIQEAISFGIPVIATNVGGIPEIVNEQTGFLIDKDFNPKAVAGIIEDYRIRDKNSEKFREGVRQFWQDHFDAEKNYQLFYEYLINQN